MGRRKSIKKELKIFKEKISKDIPIKTMIFFGSRVMGKYGRDTDIDLMIVSPKFKRLDFFQRGAKMYDYWDLDYPVDFLCYTPEEFNKLKKRVSIVSEVIKSGIKI